MYDRLIYFKVWRVSSIFQPQSKESDPSTLNNLDNQKKGFELSVREASSAGTLQDTEGVEAKDEVLINCNFFGIYPYLCLFIVIK